MKILSHRGFWREPAEKNTVEAFRRTVEFGFGTETDLRDAGGRLVVSHDPPRGGELEAGRLLGLFRGSGLPLAVNIKADGLAAWIGDLFSGWPDPWFLFDMSGPEQVRYARLGLPVYTRHSDVEREPILYATARGVWLDAFDADWIGPEVILRHLDAGKEVCVVSPDLHGRDPAPFWNRLRPLATRDRLALCTDFPTEAREAFTS